MMAEELGKIEKMPAENYREGRKLYFIPLIYAGTDMPEDYTEKFNRYWDQVEKQIDDLVSKLGDVQHIYHEMVAAGGETGEKTIKELSLPAHKIVKALLEKNAALEAVEEVDILTEFMDWSRCLYIGLQNPDVEKKVFESYTAAAEQRKKHLAEVIDTTLRQDEMGLLVMRENHQVSFPSDIQVFYVAPPALDEIKRWTREQEAAGQDKDAA